MGCYSVFGTRIYRITRNWKSKFETVDDAGIFYLECVYVWCAREGEVHDDNPDAEEKRQIKKKYAEFLGLRTAALVSNRLLPVSIDPPRRSEQTI